MKKISDLFYSKSNIINCLSLTIIMILYAWLVMGSQSKCITNELSNGFSILGLRFGYSYDSVIELFSSLNLNSLKCYSKLLRIWDNIFPFIYGPMYIFWLSLIFKNHQFRNKGLRIINLYPFVPMTIDIIENYFENKIVAQFITTNEVSHMNVKIASMITQAKWTFSTINYIIILTGIILMIIGKLRTTNKIKNS